MSSRGIRRNRLSQAPPQPVILDAIDVPRAERTLSTEDGYSHSFLSGDGFVPVMVAISLMSAAIILAIE